MDHHVTIKKKWNRREKNVPMATAWTTPPLEIVLIRGDFFCLRVVVVTDVETGEEKRSCWCVANVCFFFCEAVWTTKEHREELFFSCVRALSGRNREREKREKGERP